MPVLRSQSRSLATQMVMLTLTAVSITVLVAAGFVLVGVYRVVDAGQRGRLVAYRQIVMDDLTARLGMAERVVDSVAGASSSRTREPGAIGDSLQRAASSNVEQFDLLMVVDASGTVVVTAPDQRVSRSVAGQEYFLRASDSLKAVFTWEHPREPGRPGTLWVAQSYMWRSRRYTLIGRLRIGFVQRLVDGAASTTEGRAAVVYDNWRTVVAVGAGGPALDLGRARLQTDTANPRQGSVDLVDSRLQPVHGYWADLPDSTGLAWRVLVIEPSSAPFASLRDTLLPAALSIVLAAMVSVWAAWVFGRRLVRPLRSLAGRAMAVESGSVVRPVPVDRDDEVGRVTMAFNAMALRLNVLQELAQLLAASSQLDQVVDGILSATEHLLGTGGCAVFLVDRAENDLELIAARGLARVGTHVTSSLAEDSWLARSVHARRALWFTDGNEPGGRGDMARLFGAERSRSGLVVPLTIGRDSIGVVVVLSDRGRTFSEAELEMMRTFTAQAAVAIENSRLFEEERRSRREAEALRDVAERLEGTLDLGVALEQVAVIAAGLLNVTCGGFAMLDPAGLGIPESTAEDARHFDMWHEVLERDMRPGREHDPVVIEDAAADALTGEFASARGVRSLMLVPLLQAGRRRGALVLECAETRRGFSERQVALAATIGREVALAMDNAYLLHQARSRAANLETIFRISQAVSSSLQSTVVLNRVLDVVQKIFSAEAVSLMTYDSMKRTVVTAMGRGIMSKDMLYFEVRPGEDMPGEVFASRAARVFSPLSDIGTPLAALAVESGFRSMLAVPLLARGHSTGVLSVYSQSVDAFAPEDVELLLTFASQAALAIDTAKLYGREHRVATVLQSSILPERLQDLPGIEAASVYRPSSEDAEIGGDYFDLFPAPDGRVVMAIADVAGKGVFAATKTQMIKYSLRGVVAAGLGPAEATVELNRLVSESGDSADIVTVWIGYLDVVTGELQYADAGHPPGLVLDSARGSVRRLGPTGPVLGGVHGARYTQGRLRLPPGSTLLLYTDGVTEARGAGKFFGEGRVRRALRGAGSAEEIAERLSEAVDSFSGGVLRDDAAILVVRLLSVDDGVGRVSPVGSSG